MTLTISRALHAELLALAAAAPDREVCGLLFGEGGCVEALQPCLNVSPRPADSFEIDPGALIAAHKAMRAGGRTLIGCYHSHPNGRAEPSERDIAGAGAGLGLWVIIAGNEVRAWRLDEKMCALTLKLRW